MGASSSTGHGQRVGNMCLLPHDWVTHKCNEWGIGLSVFHGHVNALAVARGENRRSGFKIKKIVVVNGHFAVVDHTWERND